MERYLHFWWNPRFLVLYSQLLDIHFLDQSHYVTQRCAYSACLSTADLSYAVRRGRGTTWLCFHDNNRGPCPTAAVPLLIHHSSHTPRPASGRVCWPWWCIFWGLLDRLYVLCVQDQAPFESESKGCWDGRLHCCPRAVVQLIESVHCWILPPIISVRQLIYRIVEFWGAHSCDEVAALMDIW